MKQKNTETKSQAFYMLKLYTAKGSRYEHNQAAIAKLFDVTQGWVSQQLKWARAWKKFAEEQEAFKEAYENTVEMSDNGFPGHLDNTGEEQE